METTHVTALDSSGNSAVRTVPFLIDTVPPAVAFTEVTAEPLHRSGSLPSRFRLRASGNDGAGGQVTHERVRLGKCTVVDDSSYSNEDGVLHDEVLELAPSQLCDLIARCVPRRIDAIELAAEAADCAGNTGTAVLRYAAADLLLICRALKAR